jgi:single-strand DNA-binding protein
MANPKITLTGRIGQDPKSIGDGLRIRIATSDRVKNDATGNWEDSKTSWWTVKLWKKQAEYARSVLKKGQEVTVVGTIYEEVWTDKNNETRSSYDVVADSIAVTAFSLQNSSPTSNVRDLDNSWSDIANVKVPF